MRSLTSLIVAGWLVAAPSVVWGGDVSGVRPLLFPAWNELPSILPHGTRLLHAPVAIERFLDDVDGAPPEWASLHGRDGVGHDEQLFALNRQRDRLREGRAALAQTVTFLWSGILSAYDPSMGGFRVAIGPKVIPTRWGLVRFKADGLPADLVALPPPELRESLAARLANEQQVEIDLAVTGRLVPEEAIIYDFSHEEHGRGMVMPVVRVERLDYLILKRGKWGE